MSTTYVKAVENARNENWNHYDQLRQNGFGIRFDMVSWDFSCNWNKFLRYINYLYVFPMAETWSRDPTIWDVEKELRSYLNQQYFFYKKKQKISKK